MPNRVLRDWTTSEAIDKLSILGEVFFTRLIMKADDYGNYTANPKLLKAALFPLKDITSTEIDHLLVECEQAGIVKRYTVEGKDFINIPNFGQRLRAMKSQYPDISQSDGSHMSDNSRLETKRNEVETESETEVDFSAPDVLGDVLVFPLETQPVKELWASWKKSRWENYKIKYPMMGEQADLKRLEGMSFSQIQETILAAISGKWKNLYPDKNRSNGKQFTKTDHASNAARNFAERVGGKSDK